MKLGGGFGGHGFKFDEAEEEAEATKRKMTKLVHGLEAGVEDDDDEVGIIFISDNHFIRGNDGSFY